MKWHLNRILCALNAGSHLLSLTCDNHAPEPYSYQINSLAHLFKYEFNAKRQPFYSSMLASLGELDMLSKPGSLIEREQGF